MDGSRCIADHRSGPQGAVPMDLGNANYEDHDNRYRSSTHSNNNRCTDEIPVAKYRYDRPHRAFDERLPECAPKV